MKDLREIKAFCRGAAKLPISLVVVACLLSAGTCRAAEQFNYDPATCKTDAHGKVYIAVGRNVFAMPLSGAVIVAQDDDKSRLAPPDPTQPIGCPDNPEQFKGYGFPYTYNAAVGAENKAFPAARPGVDTLQLIQVHGNTDTPSPDDTEWGGESYQALIAKVRCDNSGREELTVGLIACRLAPKDKAIRIEDWAATYIGQSGVYETPLKRPFIVNCVDHLYSFPVGHCTVSYVFRPDLGVTYEFRPYLGSNPLPIDEVIEFDRGLRAVIDAALVENYQWPDQAQHAGD